MAQVVKIARRHLAAAGLEPTVKGDGTLHWNTKRASEKGAFQGSLAGRQSRVSISRLMAR